MTNTANKKELSTEININERGFLEMAPSRAPDNINNHLTWPNAWKLVAGLVFIFWLIVPKVSEFFSDKKVLDVRTNQITTDLKDIKDDVKEMKGDLKTNNKDISEKVSRLERDNEVMKNDIQMLKQDKVNK